MRKVVPFWAHTDKHIQFYNLKLLIKKWVFWFNNLFKTKIKTNAIKDHILNQYFVYNFKMENVKYHWKVSMIQKVTVVRTKQNSYSIIYTKTLFISKIT